jgi:hypothetical protein
LNKALSVNSRRTVGSPIIHSLCSAAHTLPYVTDLSGEDVRRRWTAEPAT